MRELDLRMPALAAVPIVEESAGLLVIVDEVVVVGGFLADVEEFPLQVPGLVQLAEDCVIEFDSVVGDREGRI